MLDIWDNRTTVGVERTIMHFYTFPRCAIIEIIVNNTGTKKCMVVGTPNTYYKNISLYFTNGKLVRKLYGNSNSKIDICRYLNDSIFKKLSI